MAIRNVAPEDLNDFLWTEAQVGDFVTCGSTILFVQAGESDETPESAIDKELGRAKVLANAGEFLKYKA